MLLHGELGAGKTFLARAVLRALGVPREIRVTSPTFTLVAEYETRLGTVLHTDLFRLREEGADGVHRVRELGIRERCREGAVAIVEWGGGFEDLLGPPTLTVELAMAPGRELEGASQPPRNRGELEGASQPPRNRGELEGASQPPRNRGELEGRIVRVERTT